MVCITCELIKIQFLLQKGLTSIVVDIATFWLHLTLHVTPCLALLWISQQDCVFFLYWMIQYLWLQLQVNITPIRHEPIIRTIVFFSSVNRNNLDILYSKKGNVFGIDHRKVLKMAVLFPRALWANLHAQHWHEIGCKNNTKWPAINWNTRGKLAWCQYSCVQSPF